MKICYISTKSIHTRRWVEYFAERGHEVHLITPEYDNIEGVKIYEVNPKASKLSPLFKAIMIRNLVKKIKPDILHAHQVVPFGLYGALSGFHPFVVSAWGSDVLTFPKSRISKWLVRFVLNKADVITTTAEFMGSYLCKEFKMQESKIIRIPWGIDLKNFYRNYQEKLKKLRNELEIEEDSLVILSNRNLVTNYNVQRIIDAIPYMTKKYPNTVFVFIRGYGSSELEDEMRLKAEKMGVINNVRFISKAVTPKEMAICLNMADVFISIPKTDQFGSSIMEGMACDAIPIVSDIEVYKQYLADGENAFFVDPENPKEIAERIIYCIEHPELKEKFFTINKRIIEEKEDWNKNAKKMEELYENLLHGVVNK